MTVAELIDLKHYTDLFYFRGLAHQERQGAILNARFMQANAKDCDDQPVDYMYFTEIYEKLLSGENIPQCIYDTYQSLFEDPRLPDWVMTILPKRQAQELFKKAGNKEVTTPRAYGAPGVLLVCPEVYGSRKLKVGLALINYGIQGKVDVVDFDTAKPIGTIDVVTDGDPVHRIQCEFPFETYTDEEAKVRKQVNDLVVELLDEQKKRDGG